MSLPTSFQKGVCLLLTAPHTLLFSYTGLLYHFPKSFLLCDMYLRSASSGVSLFTILPGKD